MGSYPKSGEPVSSTSPSLSKDLEAGFPHLPGSNMELGTRPQQLKENPGST